MGLSCEDRLAIHDILGRYYQLLDGNTAVTVESVFAEEASLIVPTAQFPDRKTIAAFFDNRPAGAGRAGRHFITNLVIDPQADGEAVAAFYLLYIGIMAGPSLKMTGNGRSTMRKTVGGWRIAKFVIEIDSAKPKS